MTWTLHLSPWALPLLLAGLLATREGIFLWPRRRESGSLALLLLAGAGGVWSVLHLLAVISPHLGLKVGLERAQLVVSPAASVAWVGFALAYTERWRDFRGVWMLLLYAVSATTVVLAVRDPDPLLLESVALAADPSGIATLVVEHGRWLWVHEAVQIFAVAAGAVILAVRLADTRGARRRAPAVSLATGIIVVPALVHVLAPDARAWAHLTPTGFGIASAVLGWGLLRQRLLDLGPVARTLVMVELRDPIVVLDARGRIVDVNRAAEERLGLRAYGEVPLGMGRLWAASRGKPEPYARLILEVASPEDEEPEERAFEVTLTPLGRGEGTGRTALLLRDVTDRERMERELIQTTRALRTANEELERLANTDPLTGLANRRVFMDTLRRELDRADRYERPLSVILLDLDHFKAVNDTHGHAAGDAVLVVAAEVLRSVCRDVDLPARWGGEELVLLLPETDVRGAEAVAERVRARLEKRRHRSPDGVEFTVTASLGVAARDEEPLSGPALLQLTDEALYRAKAEGRNRVALAS